MGKPNPSTEPEPANEVAKSTRASRQYEATTRKRRKQFPQGGNTRIAHKVRTTHKRPPAVPEVPLHVMVEMDPDSDSFVILRAGHAVRKWSDEDTPDEGLQAFDLMRKKKQERANARRALIRKHEAVVMVAKEKLEEVELTHAANNSEVPMKEMEIYDEDKLIAEGILDLDDWTDEELIRGYRKNRDGHFGRPPKYIPREIQQEAFRKLVGRGERKMRGAYIKAVEGLVDLAHNASSEKVRLEAQKELMSRIVGKVPDRTIITQEEPWVDILADSVIPISVDAPIEMNIADDGVAYPEPIVVDDLGEGGEDDAADNAEATRRSTDAAPPPSPKRKPRKKKAPPTGDS